MAPCALGGLMKNGVGIYRRRISEEKLVNVPNFWRPVIRKRIGYEVYYRWTWWGIFDRKIKTVWKSRYKDWEIK
jgi:hypothetical protein